MPRSRITGAGSFLPERILTNHDLETLCETNDEWIRQRTGIAQRHAAEENEATSDLGARAAAKALEDAGLTPGDVDLILCCTMTPDYPFPSSACIIQGKLGAKRAGAMDLSAACTGFIYGLATADAYIRAGMYSTILVIGADTMVNRLIWEKRDTAVLFGDGAGAVVVQAHDDGDSGLLSTYLNSDGEPHELFYEPYGGSRNVVRPENIEALDLGIIMKGRDLFKKAIFAFCDAAEKALEAGGHTLDEVDLFVPHQANTRIIYSFADKLGLPHEKVYVNIEHTANTVAATIPIALDEARREGRIGKDSLVMLLAFGAGLTWGSAMVRW
jgi:3-oxoacyl-[acyl-carrier-protein] synthase-3